MSLWLSLSYPDHLSSSLTVSGFVVWIIKSCYLLIFFFFAVILQFASHPPFLIPPLFFEDFKCTFTLANTVCILILCYFSVRVDDLSTTPASDFLTFYPYSAPHCHGCSCYCAVLSHSAVSDSLRPHGL